MPVLCLFFFFLSCTLSWLYISIQLLFCSVFYNTVISISDSLQFAHRIVMATVTLGLLHNEQGGCMENTKGSKVSTCMDTTD